MDKKKFCDSNQIRAWFTRAMSEMYKGEVPLYQTLLETVEAVNLESINENPSISKEVLDISRISEEKHGAIRLGSAKEMGLIKRLFNVMGMKAVSYYDLSIADLPVHSTVFRPIHREDLQKCPFRVFTSLLRLELLPETLQEQVKETLSKRNIINEKCLELIEIHEKDGGLNESQAQDFVKEALETFRWHGEATVTKELYKDLLGVNSLIADIVSFKGPHINHLTPRVLDIDRLYQRMQEKNIQMTPTIQGPPKRKFPILLRQTSFRALSEEIFFPNQNGGGIQGTHRARFGEIETRGAALTKRGMELYEKLLNKTLSETKQENDDYLKVLNEAFSEFPDDLLELIKADLVHFHFEVNESKLQSLNLEQLSIKKGSELSLDILVNLVTAGIIEATPITYEDFLPVSAAGIFKSNIVEGGFTKARNDLELTNKTDLEAALGEQIIDPQGIYFTESQASLLKCAEILGLKLA